MRQPIPISYRIFSRLFFFVGLMVFGLTIFCSGCATTAEESDQPWNVRQPWEGAPTLPGLQQ